jgi:hypothetical protein
VNVVPSKLTDPFVAPENPVMLIASPSGSLSFASSSVVGIVSTRPSRTEAASSRATGASLRDSTVIVIVATFDVA